MTRFLLLALSFDVMSTFAYPTPMFSSDRYPTGVEECSWLNWIADRTNTESIAETKKDLIARVRSLGIDGWVGIGNGVIGESVIDAFEEYITNAACTRNRSLVPMCVGLSDIGCTFQNYTANDSTVMFLKTDGAVASPPNHKVVAENEQIRVVNVYCPAGELELAFHTHTRLSFWMSWGVDRGEMYYRYDGKTAFDAPLWDRKSKPQLKIMWNGPEWFHMLKEKETEPYLQGQAPGNCPADLAPNCTNGFKYRVELKLNDRLDNHGLSYVRGFQPMPDSVGFQV